LPEIDERAEIGVEEAKPRVIEVDDQGQHAGTEDWFFSLPSMDRVSVMIMQSISGGTLVSHDPRQRVGEPFSGDISSRQLSGVARPPICRSGKSSGDPRHGRKIAQLAICSGHRGGSF